MRPNFEYTFLCHGILIRPKLHKTFYVKYKLPKHKFCIMKQKKHFTLSRVKGTIEPIIVD